MNIPNTLVPVQHSFESSAIRHQLLHFPEIIIGFFNVRIKYFSRCREVWKAVHGHWRSCPTFYTIVLAAAITEKKTVSQLVQNLTKLNYLSNWWKCNFHPAPSSGWIPSLSNILVHNFDLHCSWILTCFRSCVCEWLVSHERRPARQAGGIKPS